jgi:multidrug efflux pump subunit AcrB
MLVDAAIIVIENIHRHKKESPDLNITTISINATNEIGNATNIATIAIIMTFIKVIFAAALLYLFFEVIRNPALIGEFAGKAVNGYKFIINSKPL